MCYKHILFQELGVYTSADGILFDKNFKQRKQTSMTNHNATRELITNRKAHFQYEILDTYEVGIVLQGTEVKSLRQGGGSLQEAFISIEKGELWLIGCTIPPYSFGNIRNHEERRKRKLLAHRQEIVRLNTAIQEKGLTCIPLSMYFKEGRIKLTIALARGKKLTDKRSTIREREEKRTIERAMKQMKE